MDLFDLLMVVQVIIDEDYLRYNFFVERRMYDLIVVELIYSDHLIKENSRYNTFYPDFLCCRDDSKLQSPSRSGMYRAEPLGLNQY